MMWVLSAFRTSAGGGEHIRWKTLNDLVRRTRELVANLARLPPPPGAAQPAGEAATSPPQYKRLARVVLTDDASRTLFEEYAAHRQSERGAEETGWVLLGTRDETEAVVLATLPAGAERDAGREHVRFNSAAQALASRIVRQADRRLTLLGVVHTHPGSLRHPSRGDLEGDREWVPQLRGGEGVFGIGTADAEQGTEPELVGIRPKPNTHCLGPLRFSWYTLAAGEKRYHRVPVELTIGPDLAKPLRPVWGEIEQHADRLDRLARQQTKVRFDVTAGRIKEALAVAVGLADGGTIRVLLEGKEVRYFHEAAGGVSRVELPDTPPDQGIYLLLAELARKG
ncbi:MAG TPA: Mov34/MPN/PAD-1 family protein [Gemmataceae bacterium]|nr:Mov34/MPN/PAD-1 family protein [Gemmataceae bacterium]